MPSRRILLAVVVLGLILIALTSLVANQGSASGSQREGVERATAAERSDPVERDVPLVAIDRGETGASPRHSPRDSTGRSLVRDLRSTAADVTHSLRVSVVSPPYPVLVTELTLFPSGADAGPPIPQRIDDDHVWTSLETGTYDLCARVKGHAGEREVWLRQLVVPEDGDCEDSRLQGWDPYRYLPLMLLTVTSDSGGELREPELVLFTDEGPAVYPIETGSEQPWVAIEPEHSDDAFRSAPDRILVAAAGHGEVSLEFVQGPMYVELLVITYPVIRWKIPSGDLAGRGTITITRVDDPGDRLRPLEMFLSLDAAKGIAESGYVVILPLARGARYRVTEEDDLYEPTEFELTLEEDPRLEVVLQPH